MSLTAEIKKVHPFYWAGLAAALVAFGAGKVLSGAFGITNHNPGNLRPSDAGDIWLGQTGIFDSPTSGQFLMFDNDFDGIRAMARTLINYWRKHGLNTVAGIIGKYAPSTENETASYINAVSNKIGVLPNTPLDMEKSIGALVRAMIPEEVGVLPYDDFVIDSAVTSALA